MQTTHEVRVGDARDLDVEDGSVALVVTSPPYPMVEMWDESFAAQRPAVAEALESGDGDAAFEEMHALLDEVWGRVVDALQDGGVLAINVGDAVRTIDGEYRIFPNHVRITDSLTNAGLTQLPGIIWQKPANSTNDFIGSGMLPTNAYVTHEHEHVLLFRKNGKRSFPPKDDERYASAYFWEERNEWFSDAWDVRGTGQSLDDGDGARERSGAFPLEIPLRLVRMYSVQGDTVLDPFAGTGTTALAALLEGRSSIAVERDPELASAFETRVVDATEFSSDVAADRLDAHRAFVAENEGKVSYDADHYDTRVVTAQERGIELPTVTAIERTGDDPLRFAATHERF